MLYVQGAGAGANTKIGHTQLLRVSGMGLKMDKLCERCRTRKPFNQFIPWRDNNEKIIEDVYGRYCKHCRYEYGYNQYMRTNPEGMEDGIMGGRRDEDEEIEIFDEGYVELPYLAPEVELNFDWLNKEIRL